MGESKGGLPPDDCVEDEDAILRDSLRVIQQYHDPNPGSMLQIVLAPCSPFSVTADLMRESAKLAREHGVKLHTHLCETLDEERYTLAASRDAAGGLHGDTGLGRRRRLVCPRRPCQRRRGPPLRQKGAGVCHCPSSNMRLASGIAPVKKYRDNGVRTGSRCRWLGQQ